jgi:hypothetical protein
MKATNAGMRVVLSSLIGLAGLLGVATSDSQPKMLCEGFLPANNMKIPVRSNLFFLFAKADEPQVQPGITEAEFNEVLDKLEKIYTPVFAQLGAKMVVDRLWEDGTVNAFAFVNGDEWHIAMPGGIPRLPGINRDAFMGVACHEIGHHLGGAPATMMGLTNEGGADYFATLKCLRKVFADEDNAAVIAKATIDPVAKKACELDHHNLPDQQFCLRSSLVAQTLGKVLAGFESKDAPKFDTPDPAVVKVTSNGHPGAQCRLDTMYSGAVCHVSADIAQSKTDLKEGACMEATDTQGSRPHCWFKDPSTVVVEPVPTPKPLPAPVPKKPVRIIFPIHRA